MTQYQAKVVRFTLPLGSVVSLVDLVPDDPDVPPMAAVPFRPGVPGMVIADLPKGTTIMVGWSGGDPSQPFCCLPGGGEHVGAMTLNADQLTLGGDAGAEPTIKGTSYRSAEDAMLSTFSGLMTTATGLCHGATNPATTMAAVQGIAVMLDGMISAITSFQGGAAGYLATNVKVK